MISSYPLKLVAPHLALHQFHIARAVQLGPHANEEKSVFLRTFEVNRPTCAASSFVMKPVSREALVTDLLRKHDDDNGDAYSSLNGPSVPAASTQSAGQGLKIKGA